MRKFGVALRVLILILVAAPVGAGVIGDTDRLTRAQYGARHGLSLAQVERRFAATGTLRCGPDNSSTVNLTVRSDIVTFTPHAIMDADTCEAIAALPQCVVEFETAAGIQTRQIEEVVAWGFTRSATNCRPAGNADHWAIGRLDRPVTGIRPYQVDLEGLPAAVAATDGATALPFVAALGGDQADFAFRTAAGRTIFPKSLGACALRHVYRDAGAPRLFATDCDGTLGASGGALLDATTAPPTLIGVAMGSRESHQMLVAAAERGTPNARPYDAEGWATYFVPLSGAFLAALRQAVAR